jgi:glutathione S-transferase
MTKPVLRLRYNRLSPFARKVRVAAYELGLSDQLELVPCDVWAPDSDIVKDSPLGKVPVLISPDGTLLGSSLCCEYLDRLRGDGRLIPTDTASRWAVLRRHALADGIMEAAVAHVVETLRRPPELIYQGYLQRQWDKIRRTLNLLDSQVEDFPQTPDLASITLACALEYLDLRLSQVPWRPSHPPLERWCAEFALRPSMIATRASLEPASRS